MLLLHQRESLALVCLAVQETPCFRAFQLSALTGHDAKTDLNRRLVVVTYGKGREFF
jgi:hypothetical protein